MHGRPAASSNLRCTSGLGSAWKGAALDAACHRARERGPHLMPSVINLVRDPCVLWGGGVGGTGVDHCGRFRAFGAQVLAMELLDLLSRGP